MTASSHGYDISTGYSYGFEAEMAPAWLDFCARLAGADAPASDAPGRFRFLELGAGQGFNLCLLAAANPDAAFVGIDVQAEHVAHAQELAAKAGLSNVRFVLADLVDLAADWPANLGTFDYAALHGVYTWVTRDVRAAIVACLEEAVRPGGLVYCGYNTQPGWLGAMPFQHVARRLHEGAPGGTAIGDAIALFDRLRRGGADTFRALPGLGARLDALRGRSAGYLTHEYLHAGWEPLWHSDLAADFAAAGFGFVGTATVAETLLPDVLPPPLRDAIVAQADPRLRQDVQDFVVNQTFRRDLFQRGAGGHAGRDGAAVADTQLVLIVPPAAGDLQIATSFGAVALQRPAFAAILDALCDGPRSIGDLAALPGSRGLDDTLPILLLLLHVRVLAIVPDAPRDAAAGQRLNAAIARGAAAGMPYGHLAAPVIGSAITTNAEELRLLERAIGGPAATGALPVRWRALGAIA